VSVFLKSLVAAALLLVLVAGVAFYTLHMEPRRLEDGNTLIWEYPGQPTSRLKRICRLPAPLSSAGR